MEVYYCPPERIRGDIAVLDADEFHHLSHVMRHVVGDEVYIADGEGTMFRARIETQRPGEAVCALRERFTGHNEPRTQVALVFSLGRHPGRMDWLIEKATELGVSRLQPVITRRTQARNVKVRRWRDLALAAMKQCCRCRVPVIGEVREWRDVFDEVPNHRLVVCHEAASQASSVARLEPERTDRFVALFIGPEGGFTPDEIETAHSRGAEIVSLGVRRLRSETAAIAALARLID